MSVELYVLLPQTVPPDVEAWRSAAERNGLHLLFDSDLDTVADEGWINIILNGEETGCEYGFGGELPESLIELYPALQEWAESVRSIASFRWGGDVWEACAALAAAASMAATCDGFVFDPQGEELYTSLSAIALAKNEIQAIGSAG